VNAKTNIGTFDIVDGKSVNGAISPLQTSIGVDAQGSAISFAYMMIIPTSMNTNTKEKAHLHVLIRQGFDRS